MTEQLKNKMVFLLLAAFMFFMAGLMIESDHDGRGFVTGAIFIAFGITCLFHNTVVRFLER